MHFVECYEPRVGACNAMYIVICKLVIYIIIIFIEITGAKLLDKTRHVIDIYSLFIN